MEFACCFSANEERLSVQEGYCIQVMNLMLGGNGDQALTTQILDRQPSQMRILGLATETADPLPTVALVEIVANPSILQTWHPSCFDLTREDDLMLYDFHYEFRY